MATLYWSPNSPYVKKVSLALREIGLDGTFKITRGVTKPTLKETEHDQWNPTGKVPTLVLEDGHAYFGSQVICQKINAMASPDKRILPEGEAKFDELTLESLADGMLDACLLIRYELGTRPQELQWQEWMDGQMSKIRRSIARIAERVGKQGNLYKLPDPSQEVLSLGGIAVASGLWYLDKRFEDYDWRSEAGAALTEWYQKVQARPSWKNGEN